MASRRCKVITGLSALAVIIVVVVIVVVVMLTKSDTPTLYEYYTSDGINSGLSANGSTFKLNGKEIVIFSGATHYFRVHPDYWRDRLRKLRAAGLNTVETYVPWNLHEPRNGVFDFGSGGTDFEPFLDVVKYLQIAQEEDLFVIFRPGPYICSEWEFGGLPSWLLTIPDLKLRTSDTKFIELVERFFKELLPLVAPYQFTQGGPIIAVQIENEYGNTKDGDNPVDTDYLLTLIDILETNGINELFFTSDTPSLGFSGTIPGVLATANFQENTTKELGLLKEFQPDKPLMVMEYWSGWFDHWSEEHNTISVNQFGIVLEEILSLNSSFNLYMFHGGTNWGFFNGANIDLYKTGDGYQPDTSSYDYDAPLSENGDYSPKYDRLREIINKYKKVELQQPDLPELTERVAYPSVQITGELSLEELTQQSVVFTSEKPIAMEYLNINNGSGQCNGYIVYRKTNLDIPSNAVLKIEGSVTDSLVVLINGELISKPISDMEGLKEFGYWLKKDATLNLNNSAYTGATLELVVLNEGRVNFGKLHQFYQYKGIWQGDVLINDVALSNWEIIPLEFNKAFTQNLQNWQQPTTKSGPKLLRAILNVEELHDTYLDMRSWSKGVIIVNNFVLSRYWNLGPQQAAYLPAPLLKEGDNEILIFESFAAADLIEFSAIPIFYSKELPEEV